MMTIKKLQERMDDPIVRDHALIRKAIEGMVLLPVERWCKDSLILTKTKENFGSYLRRSVCERLDISEEDERAETLGKLMLLVKHTDMSPKRYECLLTDLSNINDSFGLPKKEETK